MEMRRSTFHTTQKLEPELLRQCFPPCTRFHQKDRLNGLVVEKVERKEA